MIKLHSLVICFIFLLSAWQTAVASPANLIATQYIHDKWQSERGLPFDSVLNITQTRDGYLWLAFARGSARFDGVRFTYFNQENTPELRSDSFRQLREDRFGNLWMATDSGLTRYSNGKFTTYTVENGLPDNLVRFSLEDRAGNLWVATDKGLARWTGEKFVAVPHPENDRVYAIGESPDGTILISTAFKIYVLRDGVIEPKPLLEVLSAHEMLFDRNGQLWLASPSGLVRHANGQTRVFTIKDGLPTNYINSITEDRSGNIWIGTDGGGIVRFDGNDFSIFKTQQGLSDDAVNNLYQDRDGGIWAATNGGLDYFRRNSFSFYSKQEGLPDNHVWAVYEDRSRNIWIGTNGGGLNRISDGRITSYRAAAGMPSDKVLSILETSDGAIIAGTDKGLAKISQGQVARFEIAPDSREWLAYSMHEDASGGLWLCTRDHGLIYWRDGQVTRYTSENGLANNKVRNIYPAADGGLWIAAEHLYYFRDGKFRVWNNSNGVKGGVFSLYADGSRLWFGTYSGGLYLLDNGKVISFSQKETKLTSMVFSILEDHAGNLWLSYEGGLQRVSKQDLLDYAAGSRTDFNIATFDRRDGLINAEFNATGRNAGWKTADGRLLFANIHGAVLFNPQDIKANPEPPAVYIDEVLYNQNPLASSENIELPPGGNYLEFRYSAPFFTAPTRVRFKYKLEGFDTDWIDAGARRAAYYMNLPPGKYRFRVIASNGSGVWSEGGATPDIYLRPYFYQTAWFIPFCLLTVFLTAFGLYRRRVYNLKRSARRLEQQVDVRTRELQEEVAVREQAEESLRRAHDELEDKIELRTAELAKANLVLRGQREFLYVTLSSIGDAVVATDENGLVTFLNPIAQTLTGWKADEVIGKPLSTVLNFAGPDGENPKEDLLARVSRNGSTAPHREQLPLLTRDGEVIPVSIQFSQILPTQSQTIGSVITFWDLRPQLAAEAEHRKLEEQLFRAQKMESIGTLAGGVAHDFNNLLTVVLGNVDLMSRLFVPEDPLARRLSEISEAAQRGAEVTRQLLTFSRRQPLERRPLEISHVISDLLKLLNRVIGEKIEIRVRNAPNLPKVFADSSQLGQVLMNLVVNARDAMPSGGIIQIESSPVEVSEEFCRQHKWARAGRFVRVDVADSGTGMGAETLQRIFEPFFTTKELGKGTGLGLAVVYGIVEQHNGFINVASQPAHGTTFSVYLPVADLEAVDEIADQEEPIGQGKYETILLAEDEELLRGLAQEILESCNYRVLTARDGEEAVELFRLHPGEIDLLLFDASMPRMDGREAYEQIHRLNEQLPVLFVTGYSDDVFQNPDFLNAPNRMILLKPYQPEMLLKKIRELLDAPPA